MLKQFMISEIISVSMANTFLRSYIEIRKLTVALCAPLSPEDYVVQPIADVSPPKWHLGHTSWFFETFLLKPYYKEYQVYNQEYDYVFNSYYEAVGARIIRTDRGNLSRPTVDEIYKYRDYVDMNMSNFLNIMELDSTLEKIITLGLNHEQQHQELLLTDIKYILGHNPLFPSYQTLVNNSKSFQENKQDEFMKISEGVYEVGNEGKYFCFDNELGRHKVYLPNYSISPTLVTNGQYLEFINAGCYQNYKYWHSEGWDWVNNYKIKDPLYWYLQDNKWFNYTTDGLSPINGSDLVCHISFYEASAYAAWKGMRLPTEFEWEVASTMFNWGHRWEWTGSAYLPYPGFKKEEGAIGEYNGKFMINQMVLRGASEATSPNHSRNTYRNFFHPHLRWQFTGIRLAK